MNNLNNFVEALVSISEVRDLENASGETIKKYVNVVTEIIDEQILKFINPYILNYLNTFVIRNIDSYSYYSLDRGGLLLENRITDKITLSILDDPNHLDKLMKPNDFILIKDLLELKTIGGIVKPVVLEYNGIYIYVKNRVVIFGVDSDHQKGYLSTILSSLRSVLVILAFKYPSIVTREIIEGIYRELPELKEVERSLKLGIIQNAVKGFNEEEVVKSFRRYEEDAKEIRTVIKTLTNTIEENQARLEARIDALKHIQKKIEELGPQVFNRDTNETEALHNLILDTSTHFLIKNLERIKQIGNSLEIVLITKPIKVSKFDMDPSKLIDRAVSISEITEEVGNAYKNAYQNKDNSNEQSWEAYFSPMIISFNISKNVKQYSGISIYNLHIKPLYEGFYNPHSNVNCYGTYGKVIDDSVETGSVIRLLNILNEYLGSVTLGDIGGRYLSTTKLARKGEKIKWETTNRETVNQWLYETKNQN